MRFALLFVVVSCVGCVRARSVEARGGVTWHSVQTEHVLLRGELPAQRAADYALRLEILHRALARVFPGCGRENELRTDVVVLAHPGDYRAVAPAGSGGFFRAGDAALVATPARMIVPIDGVEEVDVTEVFLHELTHRFVAACYPDAPVWLHEGLAEYFETLRFRDQGIIVGTSHVRFVVGREISAFRDGTGRVALEIPRGRVPRPSAIADMSPSSFYHAGGRSLATDHATLAYVGAWAMVHALMLGPDPALRAQLRDYLGRIALGREHESSALASAIDLEALDATVEPYIQGARMLVRRVTYDWPPVPEPTARAMQPGEVHVLWAELHAARRSEASLDVARRHIELAVRSREARARALLLRASIAPEGEVGDWVERARALDPEDRDVVRASAILALKHGDRDARARAMQSLGSQHDLLASDRVVLAHLALALDDLPSALEHARAAVAVGPELPHSHLVLGRALARDGRRDEARRALRTVTHVASGHPGLAEEAAALLAALADP